jgi:hypothetical protein
MPVYFLLLESAWFEQQMVPSLAAAWRQRSFAPCRDLCKTLVPAAGAFTAAYHTGPEKSLLEMAADDLAFDRHFWQLLVGEILLFAAQEIPEIQICPDTLRCLLVPERSADALVLPQQRPPIEQAHFGSRYLLFGGRVYRPEYAGYNNRADVVRLADYLAAQRPQEWTPNALTLITDEAERSEELEIAREWFPALQELYQRARLGNQVVVCETL